MTNFVRYKYGTQQKRWGKTPHLFCYFFIEVIQTKRNYELTDSGDSCRKVLSLDDRHGDHIITIGNNDAVLAQNHEDRKDDGFMMLPGLGLVRRVAHIDMNTVKLLARQGDKNAKLYLQGDTDARDRMIREYPHLFKACSGRV